MKILRCLLFPLICFNLACSKLQSYDASGDSLAVLLSQGDKSLQPTTDKLDTTCLQNSSYDACVISKNPVFQNPSGLMQEQMRPQYGIKLRGLSSLPGLQNSTFSIQTIRVPKLNPFTGNLKSTAMGDVSQLNTYYWLDRFVTYQRSRLGRLAIEGKAIRVVVDDAFNGWSRKKNSIHLKMLDGKFPSALQGDLAIYFLAQAEVDYVTKGLMEISSINAQHNLCGTDIHGCCKDAMGCSKALRSSAGDYFAAVMFPSSPRLGETLSQNMQGQQKCGLSRDLSWLSARTLTQVFSACQATGASGDVYLMGSYYASIWWEIRSQAAGQVADGALKVDRLFYLQMAQWTAADNFLTAKSKVVSLAQSFEGGSLSALVNDVFTKRGL